MTTDFFEFIKILFEENSKPDLIWNNDMLKNLIEKLRVSFENNINDGNINLNFDENLKVYYPKLDGKLICFLYYLDIYIRNKTKIDNSHVNIFVRCLLSKLKNKYENLLEKNLEQFYDEELMIYLMALNNLIKGHNLVLGDFTPIVTEIYNNIIHKDTKISEREQRVLSIILNSLFISISYTRNDEPYENTFGLMILLIKSFKFYLKKFYNEKTEESKLEIINNIKSIIELIHKQPKILDNLDKLKGLDTVYNYLHKVLYIQFIEKIKNKENLNFDKEENIDIIELIIDYF